MPSAPGREDPTLLLVNAGMVPFVPYFLGQHAALPPRHERQKCIRTQDIEEVGKTTRHGTFFQMNGNFSFGDYFKEQAIAFAWELLTTSESDGGFGFPEDALGHRIQRRRRGSLWRDVVGLPEGRIQRRGMDDNYWSMGVPGPAARARRSTSTGGPTTAARAARDRRGPLHGDLEPRLHAVPARRGPRQGRLDILGELPKKNIDTGMGMERMAALLQGVDNIYEIDTMCPVLDRAAELTGRSTAATTAATWRCGSSPTTCAPR